MSVMSDAKVGGNISILLVWRLPNLHIYSRVDSAFLATTVVTHAHVRVLKKMKARSFHTLRNSRVYFLPLRNPPHTPNSRIHINISSNLAIALVNNI